MKIGFMTDTHVGPFVRIDDLNRALELMRAEAPDLILLGGDYISESPRYAPETASVIARLLSETPLGGYGVIGNHDLSVSRTRVQEALATVGIPVLRNQLAVVGYGGSHPGDRRHRRNAAGRSTTGGNDRAGPRWRAGTRTLA